jgi:penicillin-insensitive murein endopeptidase
MTAIRALLTATMAVATVHGAAVAQSGTNGFPPAPDQREQSKPAEPTSAAPPAATAVPAKQLFGAAKTPAPIAARSIGGYAHGCLAGASALPIDGRAWQAMRLSRNRNWGHPELVRWIEGFAVAAQQDGWPGLLVGDLSQPRGGPMLTGHASHQIGLDADIWFTPMPDRRLSTTEREEMSAVSMLAPGGLAVDPERWDTTRARIIKRAASSPEVERVFVHPAIKKALCESADKMGPNRGWLSKVRAYWGHHYHFHVRLGCPKDSASCKPQPAVPGDDGCGVELAHWYKLLTAPPKPPGPAKPPPPPVTLDRLPGECRVVLETGTSKGVVPPVAGAR